MNDQNKKVEMITMPENIAPVPAVEASTEPVEQITLPEGWAQKRTEELGSVALDSSQSRERVPVDFPGPMAIRQSGIHLGGNRYALPGQLPPVVEDEPNPGESQV